MGLHAPGQSLAALSREYEIPRPVLSRWWRRYQAAGLDGLHPYSRRPRHSPTRVARRVAHQVLRVRRRGWGPARMATQVPVSMKTVHRILQRHGQARLHPPQRRVVQRYEKKRPGELLHLALKYLPARRHARYDYEFAAVDDFTREAVAWIATDMTSARATRFLEQVVETLPYPIEAVLTDNAFAFTMRYARHATRLTRFEQACRRLGIPHRVLRPSKPESNGKVERFFRTVDDECLNIQPLSTFRARHRALEAFLHYYNVQRPHLSLGGLTPTQRRKQYFRQAGV